MSAPESEAIQAAVKAVEDEIEVKKRRASRLGGEYVLSEEDKSRLRRARLGKLVDDDVMITVPPPKKLADKGAAGKKAAGKQPAAPEKPKKLTPEERQAAREAAAKELAEEVARVRRRAENFNMPMPAMVVEWDKKEAARLEREAKKEAARIEREEKEAAAKAEKEAEEAARQKRLARFAVPPSGSA